MWFKRLFGDWVELSPIMASSSIGSLLRRANNNRLGQKIRYARERTRHELSYFSMLRLGNARALLVAALIAGAMGPAYPDDFPGVRILGYGNNTCGSFVKSDPQVKQMYLAWVVGFITGSNAYAAGRDRLVGEHWDPNSTLLWLENYCSKDPLATFFTAADDFRRALAIQEGVQRKDTP